MALVPMSAINGFGSRPLPAIYYPPQRVIEHPEEVRWYPVRRRRRMGLPRLIGFVVLVVGIWQTAGYLPGLYQRAEEYLAEKSISIETEPEALDLKRETQGGIAAEMYWDKQNNESHFLLKNLPAPAAKQDFQMWFLSKDSEVLSAVTFDAQQGSAKLNVKIPAELNDVLSYITVSLEPKGGSRRPTGRVLMHTALQ